MVLKDQGLHNFDFSYLLVECFTVKVVTYLSADFDLNQKALFIALTLLKVSCVIPK